MQRRKQIDVEEKEIIRMDKELIATVRRPAEAEAHRMQEIAEGEKWVLSSGERGSSCSLWGIRSCCSVWGRGGSRKK